MLLCYSVRTPNTLSWQHFSTMLTYAVTRKVTNTVTCLEADPEALPGLSLRLFPRPRRHQARAPRTPTTARIAGSAALVSPVPFNLNVRVQSSEFAQLRGGCLPDRRSAQRGTLRVDSSNLTIYIGRDLGRRRHTFVSWPRRSGRGVHCCSAPCRRYCSCSGQAVRIYATLKTYPAQLPTIATKSGG